ncbi:MAG: P-loop NTPase, partial [Planctomycetota bacterium]|nr:P-loop NTPase [Planctomycetota bacterium]
MTRWDQARQLLGFRARESTRVREKSSRAGPVREAVRTPAEPRSSGAGSICVVSGKGGTGKSSVSASLAALLARRGRTLLLDADLGCANAHILQDVHPEHTFADVIAGRVEMESIVTPSANGVELHAGGSGFASLAGLKA